LCGKVVMNAYLRLAVFGLWDGQCSIQFCWCKAIVIVHN
jgi:hypothetical protein